MLWEPKKCWRHTGIFRENSPKTSTGFVLDPLCNSPGRKGTATGQHRREGASLPKHTKHCWEVLLFGRKQPTELGEEQDHGGSQEKKVEEDPRESKNCESKIIFKTAGWTTANGVAWVPNKVPGWQSCSQTATAVTQRSNLTEPQLSCWEAQEGAVRVYKEQTECGGIRSNRLEWSRET